MEETSSDAIVTKVRTAFYEKTQKDRPDRYSIVFKAGWVRVGKPIMVRSQQNEFVIWVEDGGVEDFRLDQIQSIELLPYLD